MRLIVVEFLTLDGVMEAPGYEERRTGRNAWVTRSVRDLVTGAEFAFRPLGPVALRGVPDKWELFAVSLR